jgi:hypothetical protein
MSYRVVTGEGTDYRDKEALVKEMERIADGNDIERQHIEADDLLCELLGALGYGAVVNAYKKVPRWYA